MLKKQILIILFVFISCSLLAQENKKLDSLMSIKLETSKSKVLSQMSDAKYGKGYEKQNSEIGFSQIIYENPGNKQFAGFSFEYLWFQFLDDKVYTICITFPKQKVGKTELQEIVAAYQEKYTFAVKKNELYSFYLETSDRICLTFNWNTSLGSVITLFDLPISDIKEEREKELKKNKIHDDI